MGEWGSSALRLGLISGRRSAKLDNTILCSNVRVGEKAAIRDCELGAGFEASAEGASKGNSNNEALLTDSLPSVNLKGERLTAGQDAV